MTFVDRNNGVTGITSRCSEDASSLQVIICNAQTKQLPALLAANRSYESASLRFEPPGVVRTRPCEVY